MEETKQEVETQKDKAVETEGKVLEKSEDGVELTKKEEPYKVYGYDLLVKDKVIADYYKLNLQIMTLTASLVGKFDEHGHYIISKEIKRDLVVMDKEIDEAGENYYKAENFYMKKNFYFYIKISLLPEHKAKAKLYLYEYVGDFLEEQFIISHIADFVDDYNEEFRIKVRKAFNLVDVDQPNNDFDTPTLAVLMQRLIDERLLVNPLYEMASQIYVMRFLQVLDEAGELSAEILKRYKELLAENQADIEKADYPNILRKALLDRAINDMGGFEKDPILKNMLKPVIQEMLASAQKINETKSQKVEEIEKPKEASKKPAGKSAGGKSGGGGGKKPAKKPAAKSGGNKKGGKKADKKKDDKKKKKGAGVTLDNPSSSSKDSTSKAEKSYSQQDIDRAVDQELRRQYEEYKRQRIEEILKESPADDFDIFNVPGEREKKTNLDDAFKEHDPLKANPHNKEKEDEFELDL